MPPPVSPVIATPAPIAAQAPSVTSVPVSSQSASLSHDPVISQDEAQSALDELAKLVDKPIVNEVKPHAMVEPVKDVVEPPVDKESEALLAEIKEALNKKSVMPVDAHPMANRSVVPTAMPQAKPVPAPISTPQLATIPQPVPTPVGSISKPVQSLPSQPTIPQVVPGLESEKLEDQNIFYLLGIDSSTAEQKESFLDELQQVIWEDFIEKDVELLLTDKEYQELKTTYQLDSKKPLTEQEAVITYLEKLIPDMENLMLDKAIKLKADLVKERVTGLRDKYVNEPTKLVELDEVKALLDQDKWWSAAKKLNALASAT